MTSLATLFQDVEECFRGSTGVHLSETQEAFIVEALVAGVKSSEIQVTREKGSIHIEAKAGRYAYSYLVPLPVGQMDESSQPEAVAEDGILKITFPKAKASRPLKITVTSK